MRSPWRFARIILCSACIITSACGSDESQKKEVEEAKQPENAASTEAQASGKVTVSQAELTALCYASTMLWPSRHVKTGQLQDRSKPSDAPYPWIQLDVSEAQLKEMVWRGKEMPTENRLSQLIFTVNGLKSGGLNHLSCREVYRHQMKLDIQPVVATAIVKASQADGFWVAAAMGEVNQQVFLEQGTHEQAHKLSLEQASEIARAEFQAP